MNEVAVEAAARKQYVVIFRCESRVLTSPNEFHELPAVDLGAGPLIFRVASEYRPVDNGIAAHAHLLLHTTITAPDMPTAHKGAQLAAGFIATCLAFVHNAYVEAPMRWFSLEFGKSKEWRRIGQMEYEAVPAHLTTRNRPYQHELSCKFINEFVSKFLQNANDRKVMRSLGMYQRALASWDSLHVLFAAQYLFMTIEPLADRAIPHLVARRGKSREALLQEFLEEERGEPTQVPEGISEREASAIRKLVKRVESRAKISAENRLKNTALKEIVFENAESTFQKLKEAIDGLEHGYAEFQITMQNVWSLIDQAAICVRKWLCKEIIADDAMLALLDGELRFPLPLGSASLMVNAEFRSELLDDPVAGRQAPFRLKPIANFDGRMFSLSVDVASAVRELVEVRVLSSQIRQVELTFADEARAMADLLKYNWGIEPPV